MSTTNQVQVAAFELILHSGNARNELNLALQHAKKGDFHEAEAAISKASEEINAAHKAQTELLSDYANGQAVPLDILLVHAQDHMMTSLLMKDMVIEQVSLYRRLEEVEQWIKRHG